MNAYSTPGTPQIQIDPADSRALREAFGRFATGVTVVTVASEDGPICMAANSFSSISLEPPLVMWACASGSRRFRYFERARTYAIHIIGAEQSDLCTAAAQDPHALRHLAHEATPDGLPVLSGCLARFECRQTALYPAGDHHIILGEVTSATFRDGPALTFFAGKFGTAEPPA